MKICFGCFEQYDDSFDICPHCGYAEGTEPELATYMRPGAILKERYVIGRALGRLQRDLSRVGRAAAA